MGVNISPGTSISYQQILIIISPRSVDIMAQCETEGHLQPFWWCRPVLWHNMKFQNICKYHDNLEQSVYIRGPFHLHGLTLTPAAISNYIHYNVWDESTYPFPNFNSATVEVWEWISNFIPHSHAVSANRILWVCAGFWWYHGILVVHLQDSVGAFGAKWLTKWLHHAKAPPRRGVLRWEWSNKDVHLVTTFVFCHVSKC